MKTLAAVPCKGFSGGKGRLRVRYSDLEVRELGRAMLTDVIGALVGSAHIDETLVITGDPEVASFASELGATPHLLDPDPGLNEAIETVGAQAARNGFDGYLVVLGDLPLFQPADIDAIVEESRNQSIVLVPSDDGGTAALLRRPPDQIPARFGPASADAHREEARRRNLEPGDVPLISAAICVDLDTPEDADLILERGQRCHTLELLRKYER